MLTLTPRRTPGVPPVEGIIATAPKSAMAGALAEASPTTACVTVGGGSIDAVPSTRIDNAAGARLATRHLLELGHRCASDQLALGVPRALHEAGRRVPEDVSVVGFDGTPDGAHYLPPLTTVCQDFAELGRLSLGLLLSQLDAASPPMSRRQMLVPELVTRRSTAACRGAA